MKYGEVWMNIRQPTWYQDKKTQQTEQQPSQYNPNLSPKGEHGKKKKWVIKTDLGMMSSAVVTKNK